jgi:DNA-binding CsgD family transcriptional regulator
MLTNADYRTALRVVHDVADAASSVETFARCGTDVLPRLVSSEMLNLSLCDLVHGRRLVAGVQPGALSRELLEAFDRHFEHHPLVRYHAHERGPGARRISDSIPFTKFRESGLYNDYYRRLGIDHVVALPLHVDNERLVSFVLNRSGRDFGERDMAALNAVGPALAALYRQLKSLEEMRNVLGRRQAALGALTAREREVLGWVAAGKSDQQIGAILGVSPRTVQKHLQNVYDKLGVESRTAAVMRLR